MVIVLQQTNIDIMFLNPPEPITKKKVPNQNIDRTLKCFTQKLAYLPDNLKIQQNSVKLRFVQNV